jgi:hypothetical protein
MRSKQPSDAFIWVIGIIALLAFLGVVYLFVKDSTQDKRFVLAGNAVSSVEVEDFPSSPLSSCTAADDRGCEREHGDGCRRRGYTGGAKCWFTDIYVICECYSHPV